MLSRTTQSSLRGLTRSNRLGSSVISHVGLNRTFISSVGRYSVPTSSGASGNGGGVTGTKGVAGSLAGEKSTGGAGPVIAKVGSSTIASTNNVAAAPIIASTSTLPLTSTAASAAPPPPPQPKKETHHIRNFARFSLVALLSTVGFVVFHSYEQRHPGDQLPKDKTLPTVVVVGNGWGSTAFLKDLDNEGYNVVVISPRNYFLFTPLLPSVTVGTLSSRSVLEPTRFLTRHLKRKVDVYEGEVTAIDPAKKTVKFIDNSEVKGEISGTEIEYDYLIYAAGAENNTFGIKGVKENACFLKEIADAEKIRSKLMDCVESANFAGQSEAEIDRLLHFVVVGGGPTGVEYAGELHDFLMDDLKNWYPEISSRIRITLIEALPNVLPMFSKQLIDYTMSTFKENKIDIAVKTMVKEVKEKVIVAMNDKKEIVEYPYGLLVWATGNTARPLTKDLMDQLPETQNSRRGLLVDEHLRLLGADGIFALGDCTATNYAPTAQAAAQQGKYLARVFSQLHKKEGLLSELEQAKRLNADQGRLDSLANAVIRVSNIRPFHYTHQGSLAYIGSDKAIADLPLLNGSVAAGGLATFYFWRSAYLSQLFSLRNRILVLADWTKTKVLGSLNPLHYNSSSECVLQCNVDYPTESPESPSDLSVICQLTTTTMLSITELSLLLLATSPVALGVGSQIYRNPGPNPTEPSPNYVGQSNDTIVNTPLVRGAQFDRFIQIFLENTDYATAAASPTFQKLASKGITLGEYHGITHPSQPNYVAVVGGSTQGTFFDDLSPELSFPQIPQNIETIATLLDDVGVSWASYSENMPCVGYTGFDYTSANYIDPTAAPYPYYVRRHNPFILYDSIALNATRRNRTRNFNNFAQDLQADALPQYVFITPNIVNDAHDTDINFASEWLEYWLVPLLEDKRFNSERTMVLLSFDESEIANAINKIFVLGLGNAIPQELVGTTDPTYYTHYSAISSIENNWGIPVGSLGTGDNSSTMANVFSWVANITGHKNNELSSLTTIPVVNVTVPAAVQNVL